MNPQDVRSPTQQLRTIELFNVDPLYSIPPHSVCEVVGSAAGTDTFKTSLQVKRPTKDGLPNVVLSGVVPIPVGASGSTAGYGPGTLDMPAFARGTGLVAGDMAGSEANSFDLKKGVPGFMVLGSGPTVLGDSPGSTKDTVRVKELWCPLVRATIGTLCPDSATASVTTSWVAVNSLGIGTAQNIYKLATPASGANAALQWDGQLQKWVVLQVEHVLQQVVTEVYKGTGCRIDEDYIAKVALMYCGPVASKLAVQFYEKTVLTGLQKTDAVSGAGTGSGTCAIQTNSMTICTLNDATAAGFQDAVTFEPRVVMTTWRQNGICFEGFIQTVYVPCASDGEWVQLICGTVCGSGSG